MMVIELPPDFKEFLKLLNSHQIDYLLIGGIEPVQNHLFDPESQQVHGIELSRRRSDGCTVRTSLRRRDLHRLDIPSCGNSSASEFPLDVEDGVNHIGDVLVGHGW